MSRVGHAPDEVAFQRLPPQCATVSASRKPGLVMSQLSVRIGMWCLSRPPGLVPQRPRPPGSPCAGPAAGPTWAALTRSTSLRSALSNRSELVLVVGQPQWQQRSPGACRTAARRPSRSATAPQRPRESSNSAAVRVCAPRDRRPSPPWRPSSLMACLRLYPNCSHSSSIMRERPSRPRPA